MITRITLRMNSKTYQQLKIISKNNKRSINAQIEFIIESYIRNYNLYNEHTDFNKTPRN